MVYNLSTNLRTLRQPNTQENLFSSKVLDQDIELRKNVKRPVVTSHTRSYLLILMTDTRMSGLGITEKLKGLY